MTCDEDFVLSVSSFGVWVLGRPPSYYQAPRGEAPQGSGLGLGFRVDVLQLNSDTFIDQHGRQGVLPTESPPRKALRGGISKVKKLCPLWQ